MSDNKVTVSDLLSLIPATLLSEVGKKLQVDKWTKKLTAESLFKLLLFSLLKHDEISLRVLADDFQNTHFRALLPALMEDQVSWVAIRDRLITVNSEYFAKIYNSVYQQVKDSYSEKTLGRFHLLRYDSTMIAVSSTLLKGMKVGNSKNKNQVKLTTEFSDDCLPAMKFYTVQSHLSEETALKEVITQRLHTEDEIVVFDNGLKSRQTFYELNQEGCYFVTRSMKEPRFEVIEDYNFSTTADFDTDQLMLVSDQRVFLFESGHVKSPHPFRLVQYRHKTSAKMFCFITNIFHLNPSEIAFIYRRRWDSEVLFRFLKQDLQLTHFLAHDANAIQVTIYCKLILAMLILVYKKKNRIKSYQKAKNQFFEELTNLALLYTLEQPEALLKLRQNLRNVVNRQ